MSVTVFSKPNCVACMGTKRALESKGIEFTIIDITTDPAAHAQVMELGYLQAPVVITADGDHWSGLRMDKISALAA